MVDVMMWGKLLFSGLRGCRGAAPAPYDGGRQCRGRLFLLRRNLANEPQGEFVVATVEFRF